MARVQGSGFVGHAEQMLRTHPQQGRRDQTVLLACIQACFDCAQACVACADACLAEPEVKQMVRCIRANLDCANVCEATGKILTRQTAGMPELSRTMLQACAEACRQCAEECAKHAAMEHCRVCAEACRRCEQACRSLVAAA